MYHLCVCVCVCVREREREREYEKNSAVSCLLKWCHGYQMPHTRVHVYACMYIYSRSAADLVMSFFYGEYSFLDGVPWQPETIRQLLEEHVDIKHLHLHVQVGE